MQACSPFRSELHIFSAEIHECGKMGFCLLKFLLYSASTLCLYVEFYFAWSRIQRFHSSSSASLFFYRWSSSLIKSFVPESGIAHAVSGCEDISVVFLSLFFSSSV